MSFIVRVKPFYQPILNYLEIFNEFCIISIGYHLLLFTGYNNDFELQYKAGWSILLLTVLNIVINIGVMLFQTVIVVRRFCKKQRLKCKQKKAKKYLANDPPINN